MSGVLTTKHSLLPWSIDPEGRSYIRDAAGTVIMKVCHHASGVPLPWMANVAFLQAAISAESTGRDAVAAADVRELMAAASLAAEVLERVSAKHRQGDLGKGASAARLRVLGALDRVQAALLAEAAE